MENEDRKIKPEFYCLLNSSCGCNDRGYRRECNLVIEHKFAEITCKFRREALVYLPETKQVYDPEEYVMIIVDHISLLDSEKKDGQQLTLHECISLLSSNYLIKLRNRFKYIPIVVQQQSLAAENIEHRKLNLLKPTPANLGENKLTIRDVDVAFGIFSPFKYEVPEYMGYDIVHFKDNIRFLEIMIAREGGIGTVSPLYFDGATNYFAELPLPKDNSQMKEVYKLIEDDYLDLCKAILRLVITEKVLRRAGAAMYIMSTNLNTPNNNTPVYVTPEMKEVLDELGTVSNTVMNPNSHRNIAMWTFYTV